tara:strand:- start:1663 stop:2130 length:468 start_codon:yes stop_codon:yes gene_type:complete
MLIDKLRDFFGSITANETKEYTTKTDDPQVAAAALFYHLIEADGVVVDSEKSRLREILAAEFDISMDEAVLLYHAGEAADKDAVDLYSFTSVLKKSLDETQKINLVEILWDLAYSDGHKHELEDHVIWRISELLGVPGRARVLARQRVEAENNLK